MIDNADDEDIPINDYFPGGERGHILITTQDPDLKVHGTVGYYEFEGLAEDEAAKLLLKAAGVSKPWKSSAIVAASICKALGYLPLALVHAGTAIAGGLTTLKGYVEYFEKTLQRLRQRAQAAGYKIDEGQEKKQKKKDVFATYVFASYDGLYQHLEEQTDQDAKDATEILKLFAFLDCNNVRLDFLEHAARKPMGQRKN